MDITGLGILLGLVAATCYAAIRAVRQHSFDFRVTMLSFLGGFALPGGGKLIAAGVTGDLGALPSSWREYIAFAGVAAIGLSAHYLFQAFRSAWPKRAALGETAGQDSHP